MCCDYNDVHCCDAGACGDGHNGDTLHDNGYDSHYGSDYNDCHYGDGDYFHSSNGDDCVCDEYYGDCLFRDDDHRLNDCHIPEILPLTLIFASFLAFHFLVNYPFINYIIDLLKN